MPEINQCYQSLTLPLLFIGVLLSGCGGGGGSTGAGDTEQEETLALEVRVDTQMTNDTSPALSGDIINATNEITSVEVTLSGVTYSASVNGSNWSLPQNQISPALSPGSYDVSVTVVDSAGNTSFDTTNNELLIISGTSVAAPELASRISGVAPLGVFFDAVDKTGVMQPPEVEGRREFADLHYQWDFGDTSPGLWAVSGKSKNSASGYVSAHIYETPGSYTAKLTITTQEGLVASYKVEIEVEDPDIVFSGVATICISTGSSDFTGCPFNALEISTSNFSDIRDHIAAGKRILLRRGDTWSTADSIYLGTAGPLIIGAFGECENSDVRGICENAPLINATSTGDDPIFELGHTNDTRLMDVHMFDEGSRNGAAGGEYEMNQFLFFHLKAEGFNTPFGNSHWQTDGHDQVMLVENDVYKSLTNIVYVGSNHLAVMGNRLRDPNESHVLRVWHAHKGVIAHNEISGASATRVDVSGRHALKLHGPGENEMVGSISDVAQEARLATRTRYVFVSDNLFGSSGPNPIAIGPQDNWSDERLQDIVIEKNRILSNYGTTNHPVQVAMNIYSSYVTVRNNIFHGLGSSKYYMAISISKMIAVPAPMGNRIFNNTIYKMDDSAQAGKEYAAIHLGPATLGTIIKNNLTQYHLGDFSRVFLETRTWIDGANYYATDFTEDHNLLTMDAGLIDPENIDPLQRDFDISADSPAYNSGIKVPVFDDFLGNIRPSNGAYDLGAFESN
jgi:hypothetical protein